MLSLLFLALKFIPNLLGFFRAKSQDNLQQQQQNWTYQTEFIRATSDMETRIVRQLMVITIFASLFFPQFGAMIVANMARLPLWGQAILMWEFIGAAAFYFVTGGKPVIGQNGNNATAAPLPTVDPQIVAAEAADQAAGGVLGRHNK